MPTYDEWLARNKAKQLDDAQEREGKFNLYKQEMADASKLTGDPKWDKFLTQLAPMIHDAKSGYEQARDAGIAQPDEHGFRICQCKYFYDKGRFDALELAMSLPLKIIEEYKLEIHS